MSLLSLCSDLVKVTKDVKCLYIHLHPEAVDFTKKQPGIIRVESEKGSIDLNLNSTTALECYSLLTNGIETQTVLTWEFKNIVSNFKYYIQKTIPWTTQVKDIRVIESYLGIHKEKPKSFAEAFCRMSAFAERDDWRKIYNEVNLPLILNVVPAMETTGVVDLEKHDLVYPYYEIEGQKHGRMKALIAFTRGYNPHTMTKSSSIRSLDGEKFIVLDYKYMEIAILAWLSKDKTLEFIIESGRDVYASIWYCLTGQAYNATTRNVCKEVFLPLVFGMGEELLLEKVKNLDLARLINKNMHEKFSTSMEYLQRIQNSCSASQLPCRKEQLTESNELKTHSKETQLVLDYFGRPRYFEKRSHKIRNFLIQSPAALVCLEGLIRLYNGTKRIAKLIFSVHDGYGLSCRESDVEYVFEIAKGILEEESSICPGLKLKITGKSGMQLNNLTSIGK